ncbi:type II toxin-antitoxin system Phd/YefM family antitoxin [Candidatus Peregrinibacteria bacterium]|nr:type II toxin-antitoxin system Phd/YefM family antitoxin [Candidatus Peregrinibacteria bacterium]
MKATSITIREFLRNYRKYFLGKKTVIVTKNGKPYGVFVPYPDWKKREEKNNRIFNIKDVEDTMFSSGEKNLSQKIDEIVYGASNPHRNDND